MDLQSLLDSIARDVLTAPPRGKVADYIPALARVDANKFGMAFAPIEGPVVGTGDFRVPFSAQSVMKTFALALVLAKDDESLWRRVGREPSGTAFNSLVHLEHESGIPRNPFINSGALVVVDRLLGLYGDALDAVRDLVRIESGNPDVDVDSEVARSEAEYGHRNAALAHFMASFGNLEHPVSRVLDHYFRMCALRLSCADLALAGLFLARGGLRADGSRLLPAGSAKRMNAVLLTCGTYDAAGDFAYRVGLPGKSGVGGGILTILPGRGCLCVWGPALDKSGNSATGVVGLDEFTTRTGWSIF
jgi:glutaminase